MKMTLIFSVTCVIIMCQQLFFWTEVDSNGFFAVNNSLHVLQLYREIGNTDAPSERDPATEEEIRVHICKDIFMSGFFDRTHLDFIDLRQDPTVDDGKFYNYGSLEDFYRLLDTSYKRRRIPVHGILTEIEEHVFVCPVKRNRTKYVIPFYISKEYNVRPFGNEPYKPGRFIFARHLSHDHKYDILFAEEPAITHAEHGFNVELHYLLIRKHVQPEKNKEIEPLCKLIPGDLFHSANQHYRLCVAVFKSSYFEGKLSYPQRTFHPVCERKEVSFKTDEAREKAAGLKYYEQMTRCVVDHLDLGPDGSFFYISRGYKSDQIFVYHFDSDNLNTYLENVSTNISIVDEINSFEFVEF